MIPSFLFCFVAVHAAQREGRRGSSTTTGREGQAGEGIQLFLRETAQEQQICKRPVSAHPSSALCIGNPISIEKLPTSHFCAKASRPRSQPPDDALCRGGGCTVHSGDSSIYSVSSGGRSRPEDKLLSAAVRQQHGYMAIAQRHRRAPQPTDGVAFHEDLRTQRDVGLNCFFPRAQIQSHRYRTATVTIDTSLSFPSCTLHPPPPPRNLTSSH